MIGIESTDPEINIDATRIADGSVDNTEYQYLDGLTSNIQTQLNGKQPTITGGASSITGSNLTVSKALVSDASGKVAASSVSSTEVGYLSGVTSAVQTQINSKQATITGAASSIVSSNLTASKVLLSDSSGKVTAGSVSSTEVGYLSGVTSAIQTQIDAKQANISGGASSITSANLTVSKALVSDASGKVAASTISSTELGYLSGVTSAIQTQLNGKQASITGGASTIASSNLTASRALVSDVSGKVTVSTVSATELGYLDGVTSGIQSQIDSLSTGSIPAGSIIFYGKNTAPSGFLECNGAAISRTTYSSLYSAIGTTFGAGDGSTTFNLPDLRGEFIRGWDHSRNIDAGRTFGSLQLDELKSHTHPYSAPSTLSGNSNIRTDYDDNSVWSNRTTGATGGVETRPRNVALLPCIKY